MRRTVVLLIVLAACGDDSATHQLTGCQVDGCAEPAAPRCEGNTRIVPLSGLCQDDGTCVYGETPTDCAANSLVCKNGECVPPTDPCDGTTCTTPPPATCTDQTANTFEPTGTCDASSGTPMCVYAPHHIDCAADHKICQGGACVDACTGVTCDMPPADTCNGNTLTTHDAAGTCDGASGNPICTYAAHAVDCTASDHICTGGACVDPCATNPCTSPPADTCSDGFTLQHHGATGTCTSPGGVVACDYTPTAVDCSATNQACAGGACVDPCGGVTCDTPPANTCVGNVARHFAATGTCASPGGVPACSYAPTDQDCTLTGQTCTAGACTGGAPPFVRIQFPDTVTDIAGATVTVYSRIFVAGVTDLTGSDDPDPNVVVQLGVGTGTDPTTYTYSAATPNLTYGPGSPSYEPNNDEYQATLTVPVAAPGAVQQYAYRVSADAGATWTYGDTGSAGSSDGFTLPGVLTIAAPYFTEYIEGMANSSNKAVEIYNPGSIAFPLAGCQIQVFANGAATSTNSNLTSTASIPAGGVWTFCKTGITDATHCDQLNGSGLWNGNDAIRLQCGTTAYDVIGQIGVDPGAAGWGSGTTTTTDHTLLRKCDLVAGDPDGSNAFDPTVQWQGYAADTLIYLGARNCPLP